MSQWTLPLHKVLSSSYGLQYPIAAASPPQQRRRCSRASPVHKAQWTTGLHSWHKLTGVRIHCHCTRCCAAPEGYLSTAMFATSTGVQLSRNLT